MKYLDFTKSFVMWKTYKQGLEEKRKSLYLEDLMNKDFEDMERSINGNTISLP